MMKGGGAMSRTYTTIAGDMWDTIAYKVMGNEMQMDALIKHNLQYRHIFIFPAGIKIEIPDIEIKISKSLPPWKQVSL